jgi:hypothetical protein
MFDEGSAGTQTNVGLKSSILYGQIVIEVPGNNADRRIQI